LVEQGRLLHFIPRQVPIAIAVELLEPLAEAAAAGLAVSTLRWQEQPVREEDWDAGFRAHFAARELAPGIAIVPSWERPAGSTSAAPPGPGAPIAIVLEPGQAFGTGDHPTTALCLEQLQAWLGHRGGGAPRCLDVGCGTGILSIAARLWGAGSVLGYDIEPAAIVNAYLNADLNGLAGQLDFAWAEPQQLPPARWALLLCNLYLGPILRLLPRLDAALAPGAGAILSGFLLKQAGRVRAGAEARGWRLEEQASRDDWVVQVWQKPAPGLAP